jgi:hypothetical protein
LSYGVVNWATKGLFLGERHVNTAYQEDDIFIDDDMWDIAAKSDLTGLTFRMSGADYQALINWQTALQNANANTRNFRIEHAFNGEGTTGIYTPDTLTPAVKANSGVFNWVNHTYTHPNLDTISQTEARTELTQNDTFATRTMRFARYFKDTMVQPDISGLNNPNFLLAAKNFGIKYIISDTSQPAWNNPSPNTGFYSTYQPSILIIPRRPSNLFYNLRTPAEWVSEYNCYYGPNATCANGAWKYWDHDLSYAEILDKESTVLLSYLLAWDIDPLMFHQPNLGAYDGTHSLFGDLVNATMAKYNAAYKLPIRNLRQHEVGIAMAQRMTYNTSGVKASVVPCSTMTLTSPKSVLVPVTGVVYGTNREVYGGQNISYVQLSPNVPVTLPVPTTSCQ